MPLTLSAEDLDAIRLIVREESRPAPGGFDHEDVPVESVENQTITHTLVDGATRVDHVFVEEE